MAVLPLIFRRQQGAVDPDDSTPSYTPAAANLVTVLIVLLLATITMAGGLFYLRNRRRRLAALRMEAAMNSGSSKIMPGSPMMEQKNMSLRAPTKPSHHRRTKSLTTPPDSPVFVVAETESLMSEKRLEADDHTDNSSRRSSVPQIHLTFPEELDEKTGKRESKVVVVTVSEKGSVGLLPFEEEPLPAYRERDDGMKSLDLERIGGLKETKN